MHHFSIGYDGCLDFCEETRSVVQDIADESGLSRSTIDRDINKGYLSTEDGNGFSDRQIRPCDVIKWLDRKQRHHRLNPDCQRWLAEMQELEAAGDSQTPTQRDQHDVRPSAVV